MSLRRAAAVVLSRAVAASSSAAPAPARRAATTHAKLAGKVESSGKADIFGLFAGLALSAGFVAYDQLYPEEVRQTSEKTIVRGPLFLRPQTPPTTHARTPRPPTQNPPLPPP
jgi:hypothetical protein